MVFFEHSDNFWVDWDRFLADVDRRGVGWLVLAHGVPGVCSDIIDRESLRRVRIQDMVDQILGLLGEEARHLVLRLDDLLVEFLRILILEGQVPAHHRVQDHT